MIKIIFINHWKSLFSKNLSFILFKFGYNYIMVHYFYVTLFNFELGIKFGLPKKDANSQISFA